jgi:hypothetical protein
MAITVDTLLDENDGDFSAGNFSLREAISPSMMSLWEESVVM